jgi:hypothetical protein
MFSGRIGSEDGIGKALTHEQFLEVFSTGNGFTSGCGIEYPENITVDKTAAQNPITGTDYLQGILHPGRRLLNVRVKRFADGNRRDLQDGKLSPSHITHSTYSKRYADFLSTGRFRILVLTSSDLLNPQGTSAQTLKTLGSSIIPKFPPTVVEQVAIHPRLEKDNFMWRDLPHELKQQSEMRFYSGYALSDDVYKVYGVDESKGAIAVVRPDGYIGTIAALDDIERVDEYLRKCIRTV